MLRKTLFLLFTAVILLVNGCYYDNEEELYPNSFCDTTDVTYSTNIEPIVMRNCAVPGCHVQGGDGNGDFTQFPQVLEKVEDGSFLSTIKNGVMPPDDPLKACQVRQIELWIASGAPNN